MPRPIDWARVDATTDKDIADQVRRDPDDIQFTDEMLAAARWVMPEKKVPISFRVDPDVLAFFRGGGEGYQSRMNAVLRGYVRGHRSKDR
ncbi:MAG TPA: BrnA antitoxin family protein [Gemmatimonadaceae bacterium]